MPYVLIVVLRKNIQLSFASFNIFAFMYDNKAWLPLNTICYFQEKYGASDSSSQLDYARVISTPIIIPLNISQQLVTFNRSTFVSVWQWLVFELPHQTLQNGQVGLDALKQGRPVNVKHDARCVMGKVGGGRQKTPKGGKF